MKLLLSVSILAASANEVRKKNRTRTENEHDLKDAADKYGMRSSTR